jgi:FkbM family methyltransferase
VSELRSKLVPLFPAWTRRGLLIRRLLRRPVLYGPDTIWQHYAAHHPEVVFVQIGAGNAKTGDPLLLWIDRYPSWRGTMVEPAPRNFAQLVERRGGDTRFRLVRAAITDHDGTVELHTPANRTLRSSLHMDQLLDVDGPIESTTVPAMTFATLTEGMERIDVLQIDTEGHDAVILDQVDLETMRPAVIMYESERLGTVDQERLTSRLRAAGYRVASDDFDTIAVREP